MQAARALVPFVLLPAFLPAQTRVTSPRQAFGQRVGEDHFLASYSQLCSYWRKLARESDRMLLEEIGTTSYGQKMLMAVLSSARNLGRREEYRHIANRLCFARGLSDPEARRLAARGRAVVWIDAGMHATESVAAQNILELVYRICARDDAETRRILDQVILLVCPANPDGMEMIANAYMANQKVGRLPVLYQRYVGHDNNRDFYMSNMPETEAINRVLYRIWTPQIVYNHHQTAPRGTIIFTPPFRDPFNYFVDPRVIRGIELVSAHMNRRFASEGKKGVISRSGAPYSTWWNGGLRTTTYFHNMIGILTESFGTPNPGKIRQTLSRRLPYGDYPMPIPSGEWHARQTIEYLQTANYAILDLASRYREELLYDFYQMGRDAIAKGSRDNWTPTPRLVALARERRKAVTQEAGGGEAGDEARPADAEGSAEDVFRDPEQRDARGYILPSSQLDFPAATRFLNTLMKAGVEVQRASRDFSAGGKRYRKGSYVVKAAQAFRAHVLDMFEPQWHPDDVGQGGEPLRPYDSAGWTLAMQMGVVFDRVLDGFEGPFERLRDFAPTPAGSVSDGQVGWLMSHKDSNSYRCTNRLLAKGERLYWMKEADRHPFASYPAGTVFVRRGPHTRQRLEVLAKELGVTFHGLDRRPGGPCLELGKPRIGLFDVYGGNMPTGWTRWALEQFEFPVEPVFGKRIQEGELERDYDVLIFHTGLPRTPAQARARAAGGRGSGRRRRARSPVTPEEARRVAAALPPFEDWSGVAERLVQLTHEESIPVLRSFVEAGGTILALGGQATALSDHFRLPIREGTWKDEEGEERRTKRSEFFIPGSLLRVEVDTGELLGYGMPERCTAMFRRSPVFRIDRHRDDAARVSVAVRYAREDLLASGWAIGEEYLEGLAAVLSVRLGKGRVHLYGADVMYRGQPWSTFKLVFNGILGAAAKELDELR